jgi:hypothetical protein
MKPVKADFASFLPSISHLPDGLVNPRIDDAFKFDIKPKLGTLAIDIKEHTGSSRPELRAFYADFVLHWWVLLAFKRLLELHGKNITQFGVTKTKDPGGTFDQLTAEERAVMIKQVQSDAGTLQVMVFAETWKFDGSTYSKGSNCSSPSTNFGINAIE